MTPLWRFLVMIGQWAQDHQTFVLALSGTVVILLGVARYAMRASVQDRRPWR